MDINTLYKDLSRYQFSILETLESGVLGTIVLEHRVEIINPEQFIDFYVGIEEWHIADNNGRTIKRDALIKAVKSCSPKSFDKGSILSDESGLRLVWFRVKNTELDK